MMMMMMMMILCLTHHFLFNHPKGLDDYCKELNNIIRTFYITLLLAPSFPSAINMRVAHYIHQQNKHAAKVGC
jgi:hypothetical protein